MSEVKMKVDHGMKPGDLLVVIRRESRFSSLQLGTVFEYLGDVPPALVQLRVLGRDGFGHWSVDWIDGMGCPADSECQPVLRKCTAEEEFVAKHLLAASSCQSYTLTSFDWSTAAKAKRQGNYICLDLSVGASVADPAAGEPDQKQVDQAVARGEEVRQLREELAAQSARIAVLERLNETQRGNIVGYQNDVERLAGRNAELERQRDMLQAQLRKDVDTIDGLCRERLALDAQVSSLTEQLRQRTAERDLAQSRLELATGADARHRKLHDKLEAKCAELTAAADKGCQAEQAGAWMEVVDALDVALPGWRDLDQTGQASAVAAIRLLESGRQYLKERTDALQRAGTALGLLPGADLLVDMVPAIEELRAQLERTDADVATSHAARQAAESILRAEGWEYSYVSRTWAMPPGQEPITRRQLQTAINALGVDSRAGVADFVLAEAIMRKARGEDVTMPVRAPTLEIRLTPHEVQSGVNRLRFAEGLILQLPPNHDGRNTWLMNYGSRGVATPLQEAWENRNGRPFGCAAPAAEADELAGLPASAADSNVFGRPIWRK